MLNHHISIQTVALRGRRQASPAAEKPKSIAARYEVARSRAADTLQEPEKGRCEVKTQTVTQIRQTMHSVLFGRWPLQISGVLEEREVFFFQKQRSSDPCCP